MVSSRSSSDRPNTIVCKFVRQLANNKVMAARKDVANVQASQLGFQERRDVRNITLYDHLTPRLRGLLFERKKFHRVKSFKFCFKFSYLNRQHFCTVDYF